MVVGAVSTVTCSARKENKTNGDWSITGHSNFAGSVVFNIFFFDFLCGFDTRLI
jgi:hypothetical protein